MITFSLLSEKENQGAYRGGGKETVPPLKPVKGGVRAIILLNLRLKSEKHKKIVLLEGGIK